MPGTACDVPPLKSGQATVKVSQYLAEGLALGSTATRRSEYASVWKRRQKHKGVPGTFFNYGAIWPGDLLVTSPTPGHTMRTDAPLPGTMLGKALEPLTEGSGTIQVLVMLR